MDSDLISPGSVQSADRHRDEGLRLRDVVKRSALDEDEEEVEAKIAKTEITVTLSFPSNAIVEKPSTQTKHSDDKWSAYRDFYR